MILKTKTILVTGVDGFIGSHLTEAPAKKGAKAAGPLPFLVMFRK
jgi:nucleoside-diphosphate-sugar epimerase